MQPTDHKAVLRKLAAEDGCQASVRAADHIEYLERRLVSARDYAENLRRKLAKVRHQRNELYRQLTGNEHAGAASLSADHFGCLADGCGCYRANAGADLEDAK